MMTDFALWETLAALVRGDLRKAFRRRNQRGVIATIHGSAVRVYYYSPRQVTRFFSQYCSRVEMRGLNIVTPPPASSHAYAKLGKFARALEHLDDLISQAYPFCRLGDHFLVVLRRNPPTSPPEHKQHAPTGNSNPKDG
jgi:hypothetical protein